MQLPETVETWLFEPTVKGAHPLSCNATICGLAVIYFVLFHITYLTKWTEPKNAEWKDHPRAEWHNSIGSAFSAILTVACAHHLGRSWRSMLSNACLATCAHACLTCRACALLH